MDKLPSLRALRAFEASVRCGGFALAAAQLRLTPSAISHQIKLLEEELGVRLFHRRHRKVEPTAAGWRYYTEIAAAFERIGRASSRVRLGSRELLAVHCAPSFATLWLMPRLKLFFAAHPEIDVRVSARAEFIDLADSAFDVAIQYGTRPGTPLQAFTLSGERVTPMASPALLQGAPPIAHPDQLGQQVLIHSDNCIVQWTDWLREYAVAPLDLSRGPHFDRSYMSIAVAVEGLGVCLESTLLAQRELASGRLVAPFADRAISVAGHHVVVHRSKTGLPKIRSFIDWVTREAGVTAS